MSRYEYRLLPALDGAQTIEQTVKKLKESGFCYSQQDATGIIGWAAQHGLILGAKYSSAECQLQLKETQHKQKKAKRFSSIYFLFIPLLNPDQFLEQTI